MGVINLVCHMLNSLLQHALPAGLSVLVCLCNSCHVTSVMIDCNSVLPCVPPTIDERTEVKSTRAQVSVKGHTPARQ